MPNELISDDGKYLAVQQGDGNFVVYLRANMLPVWDKFSYESEVRDDPPLDIMVPDIPGIDGINTPTLIRQNVNPIGMSYWRNINQHKNLPNLHVFLSINDTIHLFVIDKSSLKVQDIINLFINHTGEGCYYSRIDPNVIFIPIGNTLWRVNIITAKWEAIWAVESNLNLWQCHSSYDEDVHSASIQDSNYNIIGWGVSDRPGSFPLKGKPDECQIDKSGKWLLIKEDEDNRIIYLPTGAERVIRNVEGAVAHGDCGFECAFGENDYSTSAGALDVINFTDGSKRNIYSTGIWNMGYFSLTNARPGPLGDQFGLLSTPYDLIKVNLGSGAGQKICSNFTESQEYKHRSKANLCPNGEFAAWTAFVGGSLNAYIVRV